MSSNVFTTTNQRWTSPRHKKHVMTVAPGEVEKELLAISLRKAVRETESLAAALENAVADKEEAAAKHAEQMRAADARAQAERDRILSALELCRIERGLAVSVERDRARTDRVEAVAYCVSNAKKRFRASFAEALDSVVMHVGWREQEWQRQHNRCIVEVAVSCL